MKKEVDVARTVHSCTWSESTDIGKGFSFSIGQEFHSARLLSRTEWPERARVCAETEVAEGVPVLACHRRDELAWL